MSVRLMSIVWDLDLPPGEKLVLLALADQANDEGRQCWPAVMTIARKSGQGERTVRRALKDLEAKGHLTRHHSDGATTQYHVHPGHSGTPAKSAPLPKATRTPAKSAPKTPRTTNTSEAKASSVGDKRERATRLRQDWVPDQLPVKVAALVAQWPPGRLDRELDQFRDYWSSRQRDAARLDWDKTWHNRIRDQHDRIVRENRNVAQPKRYERYGPGEYRDPILADVFGDLSAQLDPAGHSRC